MLHRGRGVELDGDIKQALSQLERPEFTNPALMMSSICRRLLPRPSQIPIRVPTPATKDDLPNARLSSKRYDPALKYLPRDTNRTSCFPVWDSYKALANPVFPRLQSTPPAKSASQSSTPRAKTHTATNLLRSAGRPFRPPRPFFSV